MCSNVAQTIMPDIEGLLNRWLSAGVLEAEAADRIRAWEAEQKLQTGLGSATPAPTVRVAGIRWQGIVALVLGGILLATGVMLFVSAHWDELSRGGRFALVLALVAVFHLAGAIARDRYRALSTVLHAVGTVSTGAAIALVGQIFNIEEHWPAAILLWAIAAFAGWVLLLDQAQQSLTLLLFPAWIFCELEFYTHQRIGQEAYLGRFLLVWAIYFTMFCGSTRRVVHGILFAAASIAAVAGTILIAMGWPSWSTNPDPYPVQHAVLGLGRDCCAALRHCRVQRPLGPHPSGRGSRIGISCRGVRTGPRPNSTTDRSRAAIPISLPMPWSPPSLSFSSRGEFAKQAAPS